MLKNLSLLLLMVMLYSTANATELTRVTLDNGAEISIKDDFTWHYVLVDNSPTTKTEHAPEKAVLPTPILSNPALISTDVKNQVKVSFSNATWEDDEVGLVFQLVNNSTHNVVTVKANISFFNDHGIKIKTEELTLWQATYRLPDTYLRASQQRVSNHVRIDGIEPSQWTKQLMHIEITEIKTR